MTFWGPREPPGALTLQILVVSHNSAQLGPNTAWQRETWCSTFMHPATERAKHGFVQQHGLRESQTKRLVEGIRFHSSCWYYWFSESRMFRLPEVFPVDRGNHSMFWKALFFGTTLYSMLDKLCSHHSIVFTINCVCIRTTWLRTERTSSRALELGTSFSTGHPKFE